VLVLFKIFFVVLAVAIFFFNHQLFLFLNAAHAPWADVFFGLWTGLGDGLVVALLCAVLMLFRPYHGALGMAAFLLSGLLAQALKRLFDMPRPPAVFEHVHLLGHALTAHSFPSGHSASTGVLLGLLWLFRQGLGLLLWPLLLLVAAAAYGRVYGGVHFPFDVYIGLALGLFCVFGLQSFYPRWQQHAFWAQARCKQGALLLVAVLATVLGMGYRMHPITAQPMAAVLSLLALSLAVWCWHREQGHV